MPSHSAEKGVGAVHGENGWIHGSPALFGGSDGCQPKHYSVTPCLPCAPAIP